MNHPTQIEFVGGPFNGVFATTHDPLPEGVIIQVSVMKELVDMTIADQPLNIIRATYQIRDQKAVLKTTNAWGKWLKRLMT